MKKTDVLKLLKANRNDRGVEHWNRLGTQTGNLKSYGIGLTQLRKLAREIGRNHELALQLWESEVYDARVIALLIDDPKAITRELAERQVEGTGPYELGHVFSSCDAALAKTPFAVKLATRWMASEDPLRRRAGYGLLYEVSKSNKKTAPDDAFFIKRIEHIRRSFPREPLQVRGAMGGALMGMGKRNRTLNAAALKVAREIGPIDLGSEGGQCEPFDVVKHLTSDHLKQKLGES
ncbi:MAG TPA: hypothetical protein DCY13_09690 [Verrucomicrobiales bacterium]|nr:hypothetical protein [Verrucomicrobiales bacterium]